MKGKNSWEQASSTGITHISTIILGGVNKNRVFASAMQFFQIFGVLKLLLPLEESWWGSEDMSGSETGCGDGEELGLEAAADAGGLTNFSKEIEGRRESKDIRIRYKVVKHLKDLERDTRISRIALEQCIYSPLREYKFLSHVMYM